MKVTMKKILFITIILCALSVVVHAKIYVRGVQQTYLKDSFGEITDEAEIVCGCNFDKNRSDWSESMIYGGYAWKCTEYTQKGYCLGVVRVAKTDITSFQQKALEKQALEKKALEKQARGE